jgi:hypothetical protein
VLAQIITSNPGITIAKSIFEPTRMMSIPGPELFQTRTVVTIRNTRLVAKITLHMSSEGKIQSPTSDQTHLTNTKSKIIVTAIV